MLLLAPSVCGLFKWRQFEPEVILLAVGWYLRFSLSYRDVDCSPSGACAPTTSLSGGGSSGTPRSWIGACAKDSRQQTTLGGWTRPTSGLRASGSIYTGLSTPPGRRSTSFCQPNATQQRLSA